MPTQFANGAELYYEEYGSGPDVVISAQNRITSGPESYLELLAAAGAHVYSIQLRGFGRSSPVTALPEGGCYPMWAEDVYQFAHKLEVEQFIYTGVSHGAGVGWNLVLMHPRELRAFVAIVGGPHDRSKPRVRGMGLAPAPMFVVPTSDPVRLRRRAAWLQASAAQASPTGSPVGEINPGKVFPELETNAQVAERLGTVTVPTLLLNGAQDDIIPADMSLLVARSVPGAKLVLYQDHSHTLAREAPERVVDEVALFLREIGSPMRGEDGRHAQSH
jgi:pimeloyl-ACP methyl ester carboxylesterase